MKFDEKDRWAAAFARARAADRADQIEFLRHLLAEGKLKPEERARSGGAESRRRRSASPDGLGAGCYAARGLRCWGPNPPYPPNSLTP